MRTAQQRKEILVEPLSLLLGLVLSAAIFVTQLFVGAASVAASGGTDYYVNGSTGSNTLYDGTSPTVNGIHGPWATIKYAAATAPAGATINIAAGLYRLSTANQSTAGWIVPKTGQTFTGPACDPKVARCAAIISGGTNIGSLAVQNGSDWAVTGQTQQGTVTSNLCDTGWAGCNYPEDLFYDRVPLQHIISTSRPTLASGQWWFDYPNNTIYFHDTPVGHSVETSVLQTMFNPSGVNNITVQNLTIEEFASPVDTGAVEPIESAGPSAGLHWLVQNNYVTLNHATGVKVGFNMQVLNNVLDTNGQTGVGGGLAAGSNITPSGLLVEGNTVTHNNYNHVNPGWGAGGMKFGNTADAVIKNNIVQNNLGSGIHFDVDSINPLIDGNTVVGNSDNGGDGIRYEISNVGAIFRNNIVKHNGANGSGPSHQMASADSTGVEMYCNVVELANDGHQQGIGVGASNRGTIWVQPFLGQYQVSVNNNVHHNTVFWDLGATGAVGYSQLDPTNQPNFFTLNTPPDFNQYHISDTTQSVFIYDNNNSGTNARKTFAQYQAAGADRHGTIDTNYTSTYPAITITSPSDGATVSGNVAINANAADSGSSVSKVEFYRDWTLLGTDTTSPYSMSWNTTGMASGKHTLAAMAYNANGVRACYGITVNIP